MKSSGMPEQGTRIATSAMEVHCSSSIKTQVVVASVVSAAVSVVFLLIIVFLEWRHRKSIARLAPLASCDLQGHGRYEIL